MKLSNIILFLNVLILLLSCGRVNTIYENEGQQIDIKYAHNLKINRLENGIEIVTLLNPWDTTSNIARYALIEKGKELEVELPDDVIQINVPIQRSVVYSGVHASLINELGALNAVQGICDSEYIQDTLLKDALTAGKIKDCGSNFSPNIEKIISLNPEAILLSPYESQDVTTPFKNTGLKLVQTLDYMESTPLGRAEWMRFYGRLYGKGEIADSLFKSIENDYIAEKDKVSKLASRPSIIFDKLYSGVWSVPTSESVTGNLINDAGGRNPFENYHKSGSVSLSAEEVLLKGGNADYWLIRYIEPALSLESLASENPIYKKFNAYSSGKIYSCNTLKKSLFEDGAFHPNLVLKEMIRILHPEVEPGELEYYSPVK